MAVQLNHTIVWCKDRQRSASFLSDVLGLSAPRPFGPFLVVELTNGVSLDYYAIEDDIARQHYAFLVSEEEFDSIFARIQARGLDYWADPARSQLRQINRHHGGRGTYFQDPDGHLLEIITRPYGSGA
jgi:catechol 2,3-dioxygenase-like lactoylglutathione lyase family enzyme